jgi:hypothetical protein
MLVATALTATSIAISVPSIDRIRKDADKGGQIDIRSCNSG